MAEWDINFLVAILMNSRFDNSAYLEELKNILIKATTEWDIALLGTIVSSAWFKASDFPEEISDVLEKAKLKNEESLIQMMNGFRFMIVLLELSGEWIVYLVIMRLSLGYLRTRLWRSRKEC